MNSALYASYFYTAGTPGGIFDGHRQAVQVLIPVAARLLCRYVAVHSPLARPVPKPLEYAASEPDGLRI